MAKGEIEFFDDDEEENFTEEDMSFDTESFDTPPAAEIDAQEAPDEVKTVTNKTEDAQKDTKTDKQIEKEVEKQLKGIKAEVEKTAKQELKAETTSKRRELQDQSRSIRRQKHKDMRQATQRRKDIRSQATQNKISTYALASAMGLPGYVMASIADKFIFKPQEDKDIAAETQYQGDYQTYVNVEEDKIIEQRRQIEDEERASIDISFENEDDVRESLTQERKGGVPASGNTVPRTTSTRVPFPSIPKTNTSRISDTPVPVLLPASIIPPVLPAPILAPTLNPAIPTVLPSNPNLPLPALVLPPPALTLPVLSSNTALPAPLPAPTLNPVLPPPALTLPAPTLNIPLPSTSETTPSNTVISPSTPTRSNTPAQVLPLNPVLPNSTNPPSLNLPLPDHNPPNLPSPSLSTAPSLPRRDTTVRPEPSVQNNASLPEIPAPSLPSQDTSVPESNPLPPNNSNPLNDTNPSLPAPSLPSNNPLPPPNPTNPPQAPSNNPPQAPSLNLLKPNLPPVPPVPGGSSTSTILDVVPFAKEIIDTLVNFSKGSGEAARGAIDATFQDSGTKGLSQGFQAGITATESIPVIGQIAEVFAQPMVEAVKTFEDAVGQFESYAKKDLGFSPEALQASVESKIAKLVQSIDIAGRTDDSKAAIIEGTTKLDMIWAEIKTDIIVAWTPLLVNMLSILGSVLKFLQFFMPILEAIANGVNYIMGAIIDIRDNIRSFLRIKPKVKDIQTKILKEIELFHTTQPMNLKSPTPRKL